MRAPLVVMAALALAGCNHPRTEMVLVISTQDLNIPSDVDTVQLTVTDKAAGGDDVVLQQPVPLCGASTTENCYALPVSVVMYPGSMRPQDSVRVQLDATRNGRTVISNAALFTFSMGQSLRMNMVLFGECLGNVDCSKIDQVCDQNRQCTNNPPPTSFTGEPDLGMEDLSMPDFGDVDLAPSFGDMARDLKGVDLAGCVPQCANKQCGADGCGGSCGNCGAFQYCSPAISQCLACGGDGQFCCPSGQQCSFSLVCDGTNHCSPPVVGMEPPCGGLSQLCCNGTGCDTASGLQCDQSGHCSVPAVDMAGSIDMMCSPQCNGKTCGPDGCGSVCGTCGNFQFCDGTQNCSSCGLSPGAMCCPSGPACMGGLTCSGNTCQPADMMPACGGQGMPCCASSPQCTTGLVCDGTNTCNPPMDLGTSDGEGGTCGGAGQLCCSTGPQCDCGFVCVSTNPPTCATGGVGSSGAPCCTGDVCGPGLSCVPRDAGFNICQ